MVEIFFSDKRSKVFERNGVGQALPGKNSRPSFRAKEYAIEMPCQSQETGETFFRVL
jgi:hypothetical protein